MGFGRPSTPHFQWEAECERWEGKGAPRSLVQRKVTKEQPKGEGASWPPNWIQEFCPVGPSWSFTSPPSQPCCPSLPSPGGSTKLCGVGPGTLTAHL